MKITIMYDQVYKAERDYNTMIALSQKIRYRYNRKKEPIDFYLYIPDGVDLGTHEMQLFIELCNFPYIEVNKIAVLHEQLISNPRKIEVDVKESNEPIDIESLGKARVNLYNAIFNIEEFIENLSKSNININYMKEEKAYFVAVRDMLYSMYLKLNAINEQILGGMKNE
jgi:DNA-dependent RNA polymerase auxiliary subunit epsilon